MNTVPIVYSYAPAPPTARGTAATCAGGALLLVSDRAASIIRAYRTPDDGRLAPAAAAALAALDDREAHATELGVLVRALARRDGVYVCDASASP